MVDTTRFKVVINHEEQYTVIPIDEAPSRYWREAGKTGTKEQCLKYIEEVWTDMKSTDLLSLKSKLGLR